MRRTLTGLTSSNNNRSNAIQTSDPNWKIQTSVTKLEVSDTKRHNRCKTRLMETITVDLKSLEPRSRLDYVKSSIFNLWISHSGGWMLRQIFRPEVDCCIGWDQQYSRRFGLTYLTLRHVSRAYIRLRNRQMERYTPGTLMRLALRE